MRWRSVLGLIMIIAALVVMSIHNRNSFYFDLFTVCIGLASDGPVVTPEEVTTCDCMATAAVGTVPVKAMLPQWLITLSDEDNARMVAAQSACAS